MSGKQTLHLTDAGAALLDALCGPLRETAAATHTSRHRADVKALTPKAHHKPRQS